MLFAAGQSSRRRIVESILGTHTVETLQGSGSAAQCRKAEEATAVSTVSGVQLRLSFSEERFRLETRSVGMPRYDLSTEPIGQCFAGGD